MAKPYTDIGNGSPRNRKMADAYAAGATLAEVGDLFGVTKQRVHQILGRMKGTYLRPVGRNKSRNPAAYVERRPEVDPRPVVLVPRWAARAGLATDYRDLTQLYGEPVAVRDCRRLMAEAQQPC